MTKLHAITLAASALVAFTASGPAARAQTKYTVYCASSKIEIDGRTPAEMKSQRGACPMGQSFSTRSDAESFAKKNFGGPGKSCSCK